MSIKNDVLTHLMEHEGEIVSLPKLADSLGITLNQIRSAVSLLRTGSTENVPNLRESIRYVTKGTTVMYVGKTTAEAKPELKLVPTADSSVQSETSRAPAGYAKDPTRLPASHPYSNDLDVVLAQLGSVAHKVFAFVASRNGQNVTGDDVVEATGLSRRSVSGAFYNTLFSAKQHNPNARRMFVKVSKDVYRLSVPGDSAVISAAGTKSPYPVQKLYGDEKTKRIFEEIRALPDGSVLIEDENGNVYKAREV